MGWLQMISLRNPWWLLLALQPVLLWLLVSLRRRWRGDEFAEPGLLPWVVSTQRMTRSSQLWRQLAMLLAWCSLALAMAGPRILQRIVAQDTSQFLQLQVVVDESYSMSARDVAPSRLQRAVLELHDLIDRLHQVRMGLIVYAAHPHVMIPLTSDKTVLRQSIAELRVRQLPTEGSGLYDALQLARQQLAGPGRAPRAILLISDGGMLHGDAGTRRRLDELVGSLGQNSIHVYVLGVGTAQGAPLLNDQNGWLTLDGRSVVTRLQAASLQRLAQLGNGAYSRVQDDDSDWQTLYDNGIARLALSGRVGINGQAIWRDLSPWFVLPGLLFILLAYARLPGIRHGALPAVVCCTLMIGSLVHAPASQAAGDSYARAWRLYYAGQYQQAAQQFSRLPGYTARMAEAASWYQLKNYPTAATMYIQAALDANNNSQRAAALFNLGNSYYKQADYARAAQTYRDVLRYQPDMQPAKTNLAYAESLQDNQPDSAPVQGRAGTGYHTAPAMPGTDVGKGRVSLDQSEKQGKATLPTPDTRQQQADNSTLLQQARPASSRVDLDKDVQWTYDITRADAIRPQDTRFHVDQSVIWQRLYEAEEGFPAPRQRPEIVPGVAPW